MGSMTVGVRAKPAAAMTTVILLNGLHPLRVPTVPGAYLSGTAAVPSPTISPYHPALKGACSYSLLTVTEPCPSQTLPNKSQGGNECPTVQLSTLK